MLMYRLIGLLGANDGLRIRTAYVFMYDEFGNSRSVKFIY